MITPLPTPPSTADSANFNVRANAFLGALPLFATQANSLASDVNDLLIDTQASAAAALISENSAADTLTETTAIKDLAQAAANSAGAVVWVSGNSYATGDLRYSPIDYQTYRCKISGTSSTDPSIDTTRWVVQLGTRVLDWVSGTTYAVGDLRYSPIDFQTYRRKTSGAGTTDPSLDSTNWFAIEKGLMTTSIRTSNIALTTSDFGQMVDITSGTFTQTFVTAGTLGSGWYCYLRNSGTGDITLDPNASELIDGLTSFVVYPGEVRLVRCDGSKLLSTVLCSFYKKFTASGSFIKPPGYSAFDVALWGAGGGGGSGANDTYYAGGAGASGGFSMGMLSAVNLPASFTVYVGSGGSGATNGIGIAGGSSSFSVIVATGGGVGGNAGTVSNGSCGSAGIGCHLISAQTPFRGASATTGVSVANGISGTSTYSGGSGGPAGTDWSNGVQGGSLSSTNFLSIVTGAGAVSGGAGGISGNSTSAGGNGGIGAGGGGGGTGQNVAVGRNGGNGGLTAGGGGGGSARAAYPIAFGSGGNGGDGLVCISGIV